MFRELLARFCACAFFETRPMTTATEYPLVPILFSVEQSAKILSLSRACVYLMVHDGRLPSVRFGGAYRVSATAIAKIAVTGCPTARKRTPKAEAVVAGATN